MGPGGRSAATVRYTRLTLGKLKAAMNTQLQHLINGWAGHNALLDGAMRAGATYLIAAIGVVLVALWWWPTAGPTRAANQRVVVAAVVAAAGALIGLGVGSLAARSVPWWAVVQRLACRVLPPWLLAQP